MASDAELQMSLPLRSAAQLELIKDHSVWIGNEFGYFQSTSTADGSIFVADDTTSCDVLNINGNLSTGAVHSTDNLTVSDTWIIWSRINLKKVAVKLSSKSSRNYSNGNNVSPLIQLKDTFSFFSFKQKMVCKFDKIEIESFSVIQLNVEKKNSRNSCAT